MNPLLENPVWAALTSAHEHFAQRGANFLRYPADVAPFAAVVSGHNSVSAEELLGTAPEISFVGVVPCVTGDGFQASVSSVLQMSVPRAQASRSKDPVED